MVSKRELLAELDAEHRKKDPKFQAFVNALGAPNHPLEFLTRH